MATQKGDRFDQVDWDQHSAKTVLDLSINTKLFLAVATPIVILALYDRFVVGAREATFERLGEDLGLTSLFEFIGLNHDPGSLDFLFMFTLTLFACYFVLPLYQNPRMTKYYWKEFKQNRPAVVSLIWLGIVFVGGILGPLVMKAPEQDVMNGHQPPVFGSIDANYIPHNPITDEPECVGEVSGGMCYGTWEHPLGTTGAGRDIFATIVYGMTVSMQIAFITTLIVAIIGVSFGTLSAFAGGWVDELMMRFTDIILSFPTLLFFLLILYIYGAGLGMFILVFALFGWGGTARYVRSKALSVTEEEYIKATRISGASRYRVIRRHVVPNTASSIITQLTLLIPAFILAEAQLAFLGLGDSTLPSWGQLIAAGRSDLTFAPWITLAPGFVLFLTILAFNFLGDAMLDALNPRAESEAEK